MSNRFTRVELITNVAIIIVAGLLAINLVKTHYLDQRSQETTANDKALPNQSSLSSLNIDWHKHEQTLVLVLSNTCRFCTDSAPFYKRVVASKGSARVIAIFPQSVQAGQAYLTSLGIPVDEVRQFRLADIGVPGTPTLLLVNNSGVITERWVGRLAPDQELVVLRALEKMSS